MEINHLSLNQYAINSYENKTSQLEVSTLNKTEKNSISLNISNGLQNDKNSISMRVFQANDKIASIQTEYPQITKHQAFLENLQNYKNSISKTISTQNEAPKQTVALTNFSLSNEYVLQGEDIKKSSLLVNEEITSSMQESMQYVNDNFLNDISIEDFTVAFDKAKPFLGENKEFSSVKEAQVFLGRYEASNIDRSKLTQEYNIEMDINYFKAFDMTLKVNEDTNSQLYSIENKVMSASKVLENIAWQEESINPALEEQINFLNRLTDAFSDIYYNRTNKEDSTKNIEELVNNIDENAIGEAIQEYGTFVGYEEIFNQLKSGTFVDTVVQELNNAGYDINLNVQPDYEKNIKIVTTGQNIEKIKEDTLEFLSTQQKTKGIDYEKESASFSKQNLLQFAGFLSLTQTNNINTSKMTQLMS